MAQRKTLSEKQLAILRRIADGCPEGLMDGDSYRISAAALRTPDLIEISGHGPKWRATITPAGRAYLKRADGPNPPLPRQANVSVSAQLVDDVIAAGGSLRVPRKMWYDRGAIDYENRARLAERFAKVPAGKRLLVSRLSSDDLQIDLLDAVDGAPEQAKPVPIPDRVARYHTVVRQFKEMSERHEVSRAALPRAFRILQGLIVEAQRRGYSVRMADPTEGSGYSRQSAWTGANHGHIVIAVGDFSAAVRVTEEGMQSRVYWEQQNWSYTYGSDGTARRKRQPLEQYEANATGRLSLELVAPYASTGRPAKWQDHSSWTLEDKLPNLLREIETRAAEAEHERREAELAAIERQRAWEQAMARARQRHAEHHRSKVLRADVDKWHEAQRIRAFCAAAESAYADVPATMQWIAWARRYADTLDPLRTPPCAPPVPDRVSPEDLTPFLDGWSPYGPRG